MIRTLTFALLLGITLPASAETESARQAATAARVHIVRDDWGIAHIHGPTDADAVFGMIYAQAEDDFNRVETNYINALGRMAETEGEGAIWADLRMKMFIDPDDLQARYAKAPQWLQVLAVAWADGLNFYLRTHPQVKPRVIAHFEPWMTLAFSEGSIGGDIERVSLDDLRAFYDKTAPRIASASPPQFIEPTGSNGIAIAPTNTKDGHALLLINPHTSFYFRSEQQVTSDTGLNVYGASTWGQFFIYQGFNEHAGWMHTTSTVDSVDEFGERVVGSPRPTQYSHGGRLRPLITQNVIVPYRAAGGRLASRTFTIFRTLHGPIVRAEGDRWISVSLMHKPVEALSQSYLRTKATDYFSFAKVMELSANSSNNTVFADSKGEIAFLSPQFIPRRSDAENRSKPVDGSDPANDWHGVHITAEEPHLLNPASGWIANTNNGPWGAAGTASLNRAAFPRYMDTVGENPRGVHAARLLAGTRGWTLDGLMTAAYDPYLPAFAQLVPALLAAYDSAPATDPRRAALATPIAALRGWDYRWGSDSVPTALAVFWGENLWSVSKAPADEEGLNVYEYMLAKTTPAQKLEALSIAVNQLTADFGSWQTPWGEINRFQRINNSIMPHFSDAGASIPVAFTSSQWGSLASFGAKRYDESKRYYGTNGNSFVAVVEFGDRVRARAVSAGGQSGDPASTHFKDQADRYASGNLREVYFYPEDVAAHATRSYRPSE